MLGRRGPLPLLLAAVQGGALLRLLAIRCTQLSFHGGMSVPASLEGASSTEYSCKQSRSPCDRLVFSECCASLTVILLPHPLGAL